MSSGVIPLSFPAFSSERSQRGRERENVALLWFLVQIYFFVLFFCVKINATQIFSLSFCSSRNTERSSQSSKNFVCKEMSVKCKICGHKISPYFMDTAQEKETWVFLQDFFFCIIWLENTWKCTHRQRNITGVAHTMMEQERRRKRRQKEGISPFFKRFSPKMIRLLVYDGSEWWRGCGREKGNKEKKSEFW